MTTTPSGMRQSLAALATASANGEVGGRFGQAHSAHDRGVHVVVGDADAGASLEHGEQERQPPVVDPLGVAPSRDARWDRHGERLHLDEQRAAPIHRRHDHRTGDRTAAISEEQLGRIGHTGEPGPGHLEQPELVGRAEAVLDGAQHAQRVVAVALEREHGVDDVLEHSRAGERAVLGDVTDEDDGDTAPLGLGGQLLGTRPNLQHRARW